MCWMLLRNSNMALGWNATHGGTPSGRHVQHVVSAALKPSTQMPPAATSNKSVAVIGGGMAGLACAKKLQQLGVKNVVVFDTGKNAVGGRMSSRDVVVNGPGGHKHAIRIDHSAQLLSAVTPRFQRLLDSWESQGVIAKYSETAVGTINAVDGKFMQRPADMPGVYYAPKGMRSLALHLSEGVQVERPVWVGRVSRRDVSPGSPVLWDVFGERNKHLGAFNYLVVAHNGKCADRLMSTADAPAIHSLLRTKFTPTPSPQQVMQMCSLWVGMIVFPSSLRLPYAAAFVDSDPDISYISNNNARLSAVNGAAEPMEAWTVISTRQFGTANKVPQEAIPPAKEREVKAALLDAFSRVTRLPSGSLSPVFQKIQLWGAAVPLNVTNTPCVFDTDIGCGICGDWLVSPSLEGAALSGIALAEHIAAHATGQPTESVGLDCRFAVTNSPPLGAVPTPQTNNSSRSTNGNTRGNGFHNDVRRPYMPGQKPADRYQRSGQQARQNGRSEGQNTRQQTVGVGNASSNRVQRSRSNGTTSNMPGKAIQQSSPSIPVSVNVN